MTKSKRSKSHRLADWLEGQLDADEVETLKRELNRDKSFASEAAQQLKVHRLLQSTAIDDKAFVPETMLQVHSEDNDLEQSAVRQSVMRRLRKRCRNKRFAAAATIAVSACLLAIAYPRIVDLQDLPQGQVEAVVQVVGQEGVTRFDESDLVLGQSVELSDGILDLQLGRFSRVVIEGPARFSIESTERIKLFHGRCYAEIEKGRSGLRVQTPDGEVLDLGTRFEVEVNTPGQTAVHVFEGAVEISQHNQTSVLQQGQAASWGKDVRVRRGQAEQQRFVSRLPGASHRKVRWAHWSFDEPSGTTTAQSGKGFPKAMEPAAIHGAHRIARGESTALEFDGIDDWVETSFAGIGNDADRTVAAWVRLPSDFGDRCGQAIAGWGAFTAADPSRREGAVWELAIHDEQRLFPKRFGKLKVAIGGPLVMGTTSLLDGRWHHVAAVYLKPREADQIGTTLLYVDGRLQRRVFNTMRRDNVSVHTEIDSAKSEPVQFGRQVMRATRRQEFFKGAIDEVFIVDQALDGTSIVALAKGELSALKDSTSE